MYNFYFVYNVPDWVFALYHHPVSIRVHVEYNWMISTCTAEISIFSDREIIWESYKTAPIPNSEAENDL